MNAAPRSLADIISASRIVGVRDAVVAALGAAIDVSVLRHYGKLDISDAIEGESFQAPSIHIGVARIRPQDLSTRAQDVDLNLVAYVVAEDQMVAGRLCYRDEIGYGLALAVLDVVNDEALSRWGLDWISPPEDAQAAPLFTAMSKAAGKGTAYYSVSWRQSLLAGAYELPLAPRQAFGAAL